MTYCRSCGTLLPESALFCPACGASITYATNSSTQPVQTEFDRLTKDSKTQERWVRRIVAYIIDAVVIEIGLFILGAIALVALGVASLISRFNPFASIVPFTPLAFGWLGLSAILFVLYFTLLEYAYHETIGKSLLGLKVTTTNGSRLTIEKTLIRNLSKIYWLLLLLDLLGGFFMQVQPGQKFSDKLADTIVVAKA